jgi:hypothetical protein
MIASARLPRYLLAKSLIEPTAMLDGHLTISDSSRRNHNSAVTADDWRGLFIKQGIDSETDLRHESSYASTMSHEAAVYELIDSLPIHVRGGIRAVAPRFLGYDEDNDLLLLELLDGTEDLTRYHGRTGRFSLTLAAHLGAALGELHGSAIASAARQAKLFLGRRPWALSLDIPGTSLWRETSSAGIEIVRILQSAASLRDSLRILRMEWCSDSFIHHDLKWDNCIVMPSGSSRRATRLAIIDWEFADFGDACWDVGSVFAAYLGFWLASIPISGSELPDRYLELARYPLTAMQPATKSFWRAYTTMRARDPAFVMPPLARCVQYAGARLIQATFEQNQLRSQLDGNSICQLQLACNVLSRPDYAARHLLGIVDGGYPA